MHGSRKFGIDCLALAIQGRLCPVWGLTLDGIKIEKAHSKARDWEAAVDCVTPGQGGTRDGVKFGKHIRCCRMQERTCDHGRYESSRREHYSVPGVQALARGTLCWEGIRKRSAISGLAPVHVVLSVVTGNSAMIGSHSIQIQICFASDSSGIEITMLDQGRR
jgi:hypothetical protein